MPTIPANETEHNRDEPDSRDHGCVPPANHTCDGNDVCCFALGGGT